MSGPSTWNPTSWSSRRTRFAALIATGARGRRARAGPVPVGLAALLSIVSPWSRRFCWRGLTDRGLRRCPMMAGS
jgi:hypothetical protein